MKTWSAHGEQGLDEYKWLEDPHDPAVTEYLQAENQYAEQVLTTPPMSSLQRELRADVNGIDISMPDDTLIAERSGEYEYFTRASPYAHHHLPLYCRRPVHQSGSSLSFDNLDLGAGTQQLYTHKSRDCHPSASELGSGRSSSSWDQEGGLNSEEVILDPNTIPSASGYVEIGQLKVSPDGRLLAFTVDTIGDEAYTIHVKNLLTGEMYPQHVIADTVSVQWSADSCVLFYTHINELGRPYQVRRRVLREGRGRRDDSGIDPAEQKDGSERGTHNGELNCSEEGVSSSQRNTLSGAVHTLTGAIKDELILQEDDPSFLMDVNLTKDQRYFLLSMTSKSATETYLIDSALPYSTPQLVCSRRQHLDYCVEHAGGRLILVTNADDSPNYKLLSRDVASYLPAPTVATHVSSSTPKSTDLGERGDQQLQQQRQQHQQQQRRQPSHADGPALDLSEWETVVDHDQNTNIEDLDVFKHYMVLYERHNGSPQLRVICNESHACHYVPLPHAVGKIMPGANQDFETDTVRFIFSSPIVPDLTYDYNMATRELLLLSEYSVSGVDLDRYQCSQILIPASSPPSSPGLHTALRSADETNDQERPQESGASDEDEEVIPVTLVHLRGLFDQHQSADIISAPTASPVSSPSPSSSQSSVVSKAPPLLMHVYGAYGINADLGFSASYLRYVDMHAWAYACVLTVCACISVYCVM